MHTLSPLDIYALQAVVVAGVIYLFSASMIRYGAEPMNGWTPLLGLASGGVAWALLVWISDTHTDAVACVGLFVLAAAAAAGIHGAVGSFSRQERSRAFQGYTRLSEGLSGASAGSQRRP